MSANVQGTIPDVDAIIAFESGELSARGTLDLFANLANSGLAWSLQGSYGRTASALIDQGYLIKDESGEWHPDYDRLAG